MVSCGSLIKNIDMSYFDGYRRRVFLSWMVIALFTGVIYYLTTVSFWSSDAPFFALKFELDGSDPHEKLTGLGMLLESQYAHYMTWSGRFVCQSTVQFFCGLTERPAFEICNAAVWVVFLLASFRLGGIRLCEPDRVLAVASVFFLILATLPFDPPFLINYLWMGTVIVLWLNLFSRAGKRSGIVLAAVFLFSVISGNTQEAFSVPLSGALAVWILLKRCRLSGEEWALSTGFFLGTLLLIAAPGNYVRLGEVNGEVSVLHSIWDSLPMLIMGGAMAVIFRLSGRKWTRGNTAAANLMLMSVPFTFIFVVLLKFLCFQRILVPTDMFLAIVAFGFGAKICYRRAVMSVLVVACALTAAHERKTSLAGREKYSLVTRLYHESPDGKIVLPDEMCYMDEGKNFCYDSGWVVAERSTNPDKPFLKKYPASLLDIKIDGDTTLLAQIGTQAWIIVNSIEHPKRVVVKKRLLPGLLDVELPDRVIDFSAYPERIIDTIGCNVAGLYFNNREYMVSTVVVE